MRAKRRFRLPAATLAALAVCVAPSGTRASADTVHMPVVYVINTLAGNGLTDYGGDGGPATQARLFDPLGVAVDGAGNVYVADTWNNRIRKVTPAGKITLFAGDGTAGFSEGGGQAIQARLFHPSGVAVDGAGNVYVADTRNNRIRKVTQAGSIGTVAGNGTAGFSDGDGEATKAGLNEPTGVAVDGEGNVYVADTGNSRVRRVTPAGRITTFAGNGTYGFSGEGVPATQASFRSPASVAVDGAGNVFVADKWNHRIRKVAPTPGHTITTFAGNGTKGFSDGGGRATQASLDLPGGVAVDGYGNVYVADTNNSRVRMVTSGGLIGAFAGNGTAGFYGDGVPATRAHLKFPGGVAVDGYGNVYVADTYNSRIRKVAKCTWLWLCPS